MSKWTAGQLARLRAEYPTRGGALRLRGHTAVAVRAKAAALGIKRQPRGHVWTASQDALLRATYSLQGSAASAAALGIARGIVIGRAQALGLRRTYAASIDGLRARCAVDPVSHCWLWQGATSGGQPRLWVVDESAADKRVMSGPRGAWIIAHGREPLEGHLVFRACGQALCLNPAHLREARNKSEIGRHIRLSGRWADGVLTPARRAALSAAHAARGITMLTDTAVLEIRQAPRGITCKSLAAQHGVSLSVVSRVRTGVSYRHVQPQQEAA